MGHAGKLLITGAGGFTGQYICQLALNKGFEVISVEREDKQSDQNSVTSLAVDLRDYQSVSQLIDTIQPNYVIHLAAISFVAHGDVEEIYLTNLIGTLNLLRALQNQQTPPEKIVLASSASIYGNADVLPIDETTKPNPADHYGVSKMAMESASELYRDLPIVIARPFNYTGVGQKPHFLVPKLVKHFQDRAEDIKLGNTHVSRDFSDVRDVSEAYIRLLRTGTNGEIYNICSGDSVSFQHVLEMLQSITNHYIQVQVDQSLIRANEIVNSYGDPSKLVEAVGEYRQFNLETTLRWMVDTR